MRAVVFAGADRVRVDDVPEPKVLEAADAVVKVTKAAICASDLHLLSGKTPGMPEGGIIGHEFTGEITEVGDGVRNHRPGERVIGSFLIACGDCEACGRAQFNFCRNRRALGFGPLTGDLAGAQADFVRVPDADVNLLALDESFDSLSDEQALFAGDILTTGFYAASLCEIQPGDTVVVVGAGPVGVFCASAAERYDPAQVLVLDADPKRVAFARDKLGLDALDVSEAEPQSLVAGRTNGSMAAVAVDAVGSIPAVKTAMRCVRDGGRVTIVGVYGMERYELPMGTAWIRGFDLRFSGMCNVQAHWVDALTGVRDKDVDPTAIITHRFPLEEAPLGYELFAAREAMKVVLDPLA
jgi:threonine dehydrogenase-like Zn-dependent dehydrogenase